MCVFSIFLIKKRFDKLEAKLAHAMLSLPATKGFEIGSGFEGVAKYRGSQHNDPFVKKPGREGLGTLTNRSGGFSFFFEMVLLLLLLLLLLLALLRLVSVC